MKRIGILPCVLWVLALPAAAPAAGAEDAPAPRTVDDARVPVAHLEWMVMPLRRAELEVEVSAWLGVLQKKVAEISAEEIAIKQRAAAAAEASREAKEARAAAEEAAEQAEEAEEAAGESAAPSAGGPGSAPAAAETQAAAAEEQAAVAEEAQADADEAAEKKRESLDLVVRLREERTAIVDRLNVVLTEFEKKGGDRSEADRYVKAVSGMKLDVSDAEAVWANLRGWLVSKEGGMRWGWNILLFLLTLLAFWILSQLVGGATRRGLGVARRMPGLLREFLVTMTRRIVFVVGIVVALSMLEVPVGPFLAVIGAAGLVIGLALQGTLSNFASGMLILLNRPFDVGDYVQCAGIAGTVQSVTLFSTKIATADNQLLIVPNNSVWGDVITNITGKQTRRVDMTFGIGYGDDLAAAQSILEKILAEHSLVLKEPAPLVKVHELADSSVNFIVRPWVRTSDYWTVYWDVTRAVKERFDAEGVSIPFPQRDVHLYQETPVEAAAGAS